MKQFLKLKNSILFLFVFLLIGNQVIAQPLNDSCSNADVVVLGVDNFGIGVYSSNTFDMTLATKDLTETFYSTLVSAGNDKKSIWFKFNLPTARGVKIELKQPGTAIASADAGFTTYYSNSC